MAAEAVRRPVSKVVSSEDEHLILVDESDREIGHLSKGACHDGVGVLHRAFSLFIFNSAGELLLQQRSGEKRLWPLFWSNSCCSHPRRGETMEVATGRRLAQELGMTGRFHHLFTFQYQAPYLDIGSEHEVCWVFAGVSKEPPRPNANEIADVRWIAADDLDREFEAQPEVFTPWFALEWPRVKTGAQEILAGTP
ncbi:MAG: isopentenyl-diphosphate Delta-isomerase [Thermoanaerobaculales bacterium]